MISHYDTAYEFLTDMNVDFSLCDLGQHQRKPYPINSIKGQRADNKLNSVVTSLNMGTISSTLRA